MDCTLVAGEKLPSTAGPGLMKLVTAPFCASFSPLRQPWPASVKGVEAHGRQHCSGLPNRVPLGIQSLSGVIRVGASGLQVTLLLLKVQGDL